jgi:hypothetical protein
VPAVGPDGQRGPDLALLAVLVAVAHATDHVALADDATHLGIEQQPECGEPSGRGRDQVEKVPLRYERNIRVFARKSPEVGERDLTPVGLQRHRVRLAVWQRVELLGQPQFVEYPQRGGMDRVSAEVA